METKILFSIIGLIISFFILIIAFWRVYLLNKQLNMLINQNKTNEERFNKKFKLLQQQIYDQHEWYRRDKSIQYSGLFHPEIKKARTNLDKEFNLMTRKDPIPLSELFNKLDKDKHLKADLNYLLTYYENIAIACKMKVADEKIIKLMLKGSIIRYRKKLSNYIDNRREQANHYKLWENFVDLADNWMMLDKKATFELSKTGKK